MEPPLAKRPAAGGPDVAHHPPPHLLVLRPLVAEGVHVEPRGLVLVGEVEPPRLAPLAPGRHEASGAEIAGPEHGAVDQGLGRRATKPLRTDELAAQEPGVVVGVQVPVDQRGVAEGHVAVGRALAVGQGGLGVGAAAVERRGAGEGATQRRGVRGLPARGGGEEVAPGRGHLGIGVARREVERRPGRPVERAAGRDRRRAARHHGVEQPDLEGVAHAPGQLGGAQDGSVEADAARVEELLRRAAVTRGHALEEVEPLREEGALLRVEELDRSRGSAGWRRPPPDRSRG